MWDNPIELGHDYFVYALVKPACGEIRYVGATMSPRMRLSGHRADNNHLEKRAWIESAEFSGDKVVLRVLEVVPAYCTFEDLTRRERVWQEVLWRNGCALLNRDNYFKHRIRKMKP